VTLCTFKVRRSKVKVTENILWRFPAYGLLFQAAIAHSVPDLWQ